SVLGIPCRHGERRHRIDPLPLCLERLPARYDDLRRRVGAQQTPTLRHVAGIGPNTSVWPPGEARSDLAVDTLRLRHAAIRYLHLLAGYPSPTAAAVVSTYCSKTNN